MFKYHLKFFQLVLFFLNSSSIDYQVSFWTPATQISYIPARWLYVVVIYSLTLCCIAKWYIILQYHEIFFRLTAPRCPGMAAGAVSLRKSHDIITLSFCNIVKGQAKTHKSCVFFQKVFSGFSRCESILKNTKGQKPLAPWCIISQDILVT